MIARTLIDGSRFSFRYVSSWAASGFVNDRLPIGAVVKWCPLPSICVVEEVDPPLYALGLVDPPLYALGL